MIIKKVYFCVVYNDTSNNLDCASPGWKPKQNLLLTGVLTAAVKPNSQSGEVISEVGGFPKKYKTHLIFLVADVIG